MITNATSPATVQKVEPPKAKRPGRPKKDEEQASDDK